MLRTAKELTFRHFVVDRTGLIFASAREQISNRVCNFLINSQTGTVLAQVSNRFETISREYAEDIRRQAENHYGRLPTYRIARLELS